MRAWLQEILPSRIADAWCSFRAQQSYAHWSSLAPEDYPAAVAAWYRKRTGCDLDLEAPRTFDEKINWIKLYGATPLAEQLSDKYLARSWVAQRAGKDVLVPLLGVWDDPADIDFDALPERFVLKATHGCGWNIVVRDKALLDVGSARKQLRAWLDKNYSFVEAFELQYLNCQPRIIAEAYLENEPGDLYDYKFFCFKGRAACVGFVRGRSSNSQEACFDRSWNRLPCTYYTHPRILGDVPRPARFEDAVDLAEKLAAGFEHVRVDLYLPGDGSVRFGEMTFTSCSGVNSWDPPEYNDYFGSLIDLSAYPAYARQGTGEGADACCP